MDQVTVRMFQQVQQLIEHVCKPLQNYTDLRIMGDIWCSLYTNNNRYKSSDKWSELFSNESYRLFMNKTEGNKLLTTLTAIQIIEDFAISDSQIPLLSQSVEQSLNLALKTHAQFEDLLSGLSASISNVHKLSFKEQLLLAYMIKENEKVKEIAYWAGIFKLTAKEKRQKVRKRTILKAGTTKSAKLERLHPHEYLRADSPEAALDFIHRLAESNVKTYDYKTNTILHKGALIVCFDESGSMKDLDSQGKGFILALLSMALRDQRDFVFIPFSSEVDNKSIQFFKKGKSNAQQLVQLIQSYSGGGTSFKSPLSYAMKYMEGSKVNGDLLFITDGISHIDDDFIKAFQKRKQERKFHMTSLIIGLNNHEGKLGLLSNEVIKLSDFTNVHSERVFEL